ILDRRETSATRSRAKTQAKRCDAFDFRIQRAFRRSLPVRVILLVGARADKLGHDASKVTMRHLDSEAWWVESYDESSGQFALVRGTAHIGAPAASVPAPEPRAMQSPFVDQFSA